MQIPDQEQVNAEVEKQKRIDHFHETTNPFKDGDTCTVCFKIKDHRKFWEEMTANLFGPSSKIEGGFHGANLERIDIFDINKKNEYLLEQLEICIDKVRHSNSHKFADRPDGL